MKAIVIGSKGFIGTRLVNALRYMDDEVVELDLPRIDISAFSPDDPIFNEIIDGADVLYHLAVMNLEHCKRDYRECIITNVLGTANVMEAARKAGIKRVIYSSASSIYGDPIHLPVSEDHPQMPLTLYGATKLAAEKIINAYSNNFGLTYGIFRFTNVYGPGQVNGLIPSVIRGLMEGTEISVTGTGDQTRDFVYVDDVVDLLVQAADYPLYSFVCNLGSGHTHSVNEIIRALAGFTGKEPHVMYGTMQKDRGAFMADLHKFRQIFNDCKFTPLEEGLCKTVEWWKTQRVPAR